LIVLFESAALLRRQSLSLHPANRRATTACFTIVTGIGPFANRKLAPKPIDIVDFSAMPSI
jgi:hypothetical protein